MTEDPEGPALGRLAALQLPWSSSALRIASLLRCVIDIYIYIYMHIYAYIFKYIQIYSNICKYIQIYSNIFTYIHIYSNIFKYIQIYANIFKYIQIYSYIFIYIQIYSNIVGTVVGSAATSRPLPWQSVAGARQTGHLPQGWCPISPATAQCAYQRQGNLNDRRPRGAGLGPFGSPAAALEFLRVEDSEPPSMCH